MSGGAAARCSRRGPKAVYQRICHPTPPETMATAPSQTPEEHDDRSADAAKGRQDGGVVGQTAGKPTYGSGGYELNLDDPEASGSGSAGSSTTKNPPESTEDSE